VLKTRSHCVAISGQDKYDGRGRDRCDIARFVLGRHYCSVRKIQ
jgi:hypothetical protein